MIGKLLCLLLIATSYRLYRLYCNNINNYCHVHTTLLHTIVGLIAMHGKSLTSYNYYVTSLCKLKAQVKLVVLLEYINLSSY